MLKKEIEFTDLEGKPKVNDFYFNLSKTEVMEMEVSLEGGFSGHLTRIAKAEDPKEIFALIKKIVLASYGEKDPGGLKFLKKDKDGKPLCDGFEQTFAYDELMMLLTTDAQRAADFVNGVMPPPPNPPPPAK